MLQRWTNLVIVAAGPPRIVNQPLFNTVWIKENEIQLSSIKGLHY